MILKEDVIEFFDSCAPSWDEWMIKCDKKICTILDNVGVKKGSKVLDVACGTGVLIPYYLGRDVESVLGVDISPKMIEIAKEKFDNERVSFLTADVECVDIDSDYDCIVVYNAFPHFQDGERLIKFLAHHLKRGGKLTIAHGASREEIDSHHKGHAAKVSNGLMEAGDLSDIISRYLKVTTVISNEEMYQVVGENLR